MSEVVTSELAGLERQLEESKLLVERRNLALRLSQNHDFRKLILEDFCVQEAARYVHSSADPALEPNQRADALALAQASGHLKRFLSLCIQMGAYAERNLGELSQTIDQVRAEEGAL
jgi:hypothetical protein